MSIFDLRYFETYEPPLQSLRELTLRIRFTTISFDYQSVFKTDKWVEPFANLLFPAIGLTNVDTMTSYADPYSVPGYCSEADEYDYRQDLVTSDYINSFCQYQFTWFAYESLCRNTPQGSNLTSQNRNNHSILESQLPDFQKSNFYKTYLHCFKVAAQSYPEVCLLNHTQNLRSILGRAAKMSTNFRNYILHGREEPPSEYDVTDQYLSYHLSEGSTTFKSYRLIVFTRMLLNLMVVLIYSELRDKSTFEIDNLGLFSFDSSNLELPCTFILNLVTHWSDDYVATIQTNTLRELGRGCRISKTELNSFIDLVDLNRAI